MNFPDLNLQAFGPELFLAAAALWALLAGAFSSHGRGGAWFGGAFVVAALAWWWRLAPTAWSFGGDYGGDGLSYFARGFFLLVGLAMTLLFSDGRGVGIRQQGEFLCLVYISILGMMVMASAQNWVLIFLGLETMSIPLYVMAAFYRTDRASIEAGVKYFIYGAFASAFLVYGLALLYTSTGSVDQLVLQESGPFDRLAAAGLLLILIGLAFKVAAVPFHMWAPDAYTGAPTLVTSFFAVAPKAAGFIALYRIAQIATASGAADVALSLLGGLAVLTIIGGNLWALVQTRLKRMLAYSSIAHAGYLLLALVARDEGGTAALLFYLAAYGMMTLGAFVVLLAYERDGSADTYEDISGGAHRRPFLAFAMTVFMISLAGIPATAGFIGKFQIFRGLVYGGHIGLVLVAVAGTLVSVAYYLRVVVYLYMRPERDLTRVPIPRAWGLVAALLAIGVLAFGLFPESLWTTVESWAGIMYHTAILAAP